MIADRDFYSLLRQQELLLRPNRASSQMGLHPLTHRGRSLEFSEYREYHPGEDLRDLDWKLFARTDRYYVKQRDSHTPAAALLLVDDSTSMHFHSERATLSKLRTALLCAFAFAYVLHRQGDALAFRALSQAQPAVPPRTSRRAFRHLVRYYHLKGGQHNETCRDLVWRSSLEDASWPVVEITREVIADGATPVICMNGSHGEKKEGYDYTDIVQRDMDFIRNAIPEIG